MQVFSATFQDVSIHVQAATGLNVEFFFAIAKPTQSLVF